MKFKLVFVCLVTLVISACATRYQDSSTSLTGGYSVKHLEGDIYRVEFGSNGFTTRETNQTYWLYKCAELSLEKGYDGFEILSHITLTQSLTPEQLFEGSSEYKKAQYVYTPVYIDNSNKPLIEADIRLIKAPFEVAPPKVFDAKSLKAAIDEYVTGEKCSMGNVCEHVHKYLHPEGTFDSET